MASEPTPRSYSQSLGQMIGTFISKTGIARLKIGNPILSIFESVAQSQLRSSSDIFQLLNAKNLDNSTGLALSNIGKDENISKITARASTGFVVVTDTSFTKISSQVYEGTGAPIAGSVSINVANAANFPASGSIYIGRNTSNYEGPLTYSSVTNNTSFWTINLSTPTSRFHNLGESVVVAQGGNRTVNSGVLVQTQQGNTVQAVQFKTLYPFSIPDGETTSLNVLVAATTVGSSTNIAANAIQGFVSPPFSGAIATNPLPFTNGVDTQTDPQFRDSIRLARQTRGLGTKLAIQNAALNTFSPDENKTVTSVNYVTRLGDPDTLYIDDGTGYEELPVPVSSDVIVDSAMGGEQFLNVDSPTPITKAFLQTSLSAPFNLVDGSSLAVTIGNTLSVHTFNSIDFDNISTASAYEVSASINGDPNCLYSARTSNGGSQVVIFAKQFNFEQLQIHSLSSGDANESLGFSLNLAATLNLYKNGVLLTKDGANATFLSNPFGLWGTLSGNQTLIISIDNTPANTFTFTDSDFDDINAGFTTLGNNSLVAWVQVINNKIPGITASVVGSQLQLISNLGANANASIDITGGTLVSNAMFTVGSVSGKANDYSFDRNLGQIKLSIPLAVGDTLTAGTSDSRAFIQSNALTTIDLASNANLWFGIDTNYEIVSTGIVQSSVLDVTYQYPSNPWAYRTRFTSASSIFSDVLPNDLMIVWDSSADSTLQHTWRVTAADSTYVEIDKPNCNAARFQACSVVLSDGRLFVVGGYSSTSFIPLASAEIFDPSTKIWTPTKPMSIGRAEAMATLLPNGKVLVVGGYTLTNLEQNNSIEWDIITTDVAEVYDPTSDTWTIVSPYDHTVADGICIVLTSGTNSGKVLVGGGESNDGSSFSLYADCYLYDPTADTWSSTGSLNTARSKCANVLLGNGNILSAGGISAINTPLNSSEYYSPTSGIWTNSGNSMSVARWSGNIVWNSGQTKAELFGGFIAGTVPSAALDRYDQSANTWSTGTSASNAMGPGVWVYSSSQTKIVAIGCDGSHDTANVQLYDPSANTWSSGTAPIIQPCVYGLGYESAAGYITVSHGDTNDYNESNSIASALSAIYNISGNSWDVLDPFVNVSGNTLTLSEKGIVFVRSVRAPVKAEISSATSITPYSLESSINSDLTGGFSQVYKNNYLRIESNTQSTNGSIGLMTADSFGQELTLPISNEIQNLTGSNGSVESGLGEVDIPWVIATQLYGSSETAIETSQVFSNTFYTDSSINVMFGEVSASYVSLLNRTPYYDYGQNRWFYTPIASQFNPQPSLFIRNFPESTPGIDARLHLMQPYRFSAYDTLSVLIDNDLVSKNYNINMWRTLVPTNSTYSSTNAFLDGDNSNSSLAVAFGYGSNSFDFNDFAVHMAPRVKTFPLDSTKSILYRFNKLGPDGNNTLLEYVLPSGPNQPVSQSVDIDTNLNYSLNVIQISLASGAAATNLILSSNAQIGAAVVATAADSQELMFLLGFTVATNSRSSNVVTFNLTLPTGLTDHGIGVGALIYYSGDSNVPAGTYIVTSRGTTYITASITGADFSTTSVTATISWDTQAATFASLSPSLAIGQFFRFNGNYGGQDFQNQTIRITSFGNQYVTGVIRARNNSYSPSTVASWYPVVDPSNILIFANPAQTAGAIASAINSNQSGAAVNATLLGDGSGVIDRSTVEQYFDFYYQLTDGLNYIKTTTAPSLISDNYSLTFKDPIYPDLTSGADWNNEVIHIVPVTTENNKNWLNTPGVTGLSTVATVERSTRSEKLQITTQSVGSQGSVQVVGGSANNDQVVIYGSPSFSQNAASYAFSYGWMALKVKTNSAQNLIAGSWVKATNTLPAFRQGPLYAGNSNISVSASNGLFYSTSDMFNSAFSRSDVTAGAFEVLNANYVIVHNITDVYDDGWISVELPTNNSSTPVSSLNCGIFKVLRIQKLDQMNSVLISNPNAIEQSYVDFSFTYIRNFNELALPGDSLLINTSALGQTNMGQRTMLSIGKAYAQLPAGAITRSSGTVTVSAPYVHGLQVGDSFTLSPGETLFAAKAYTVVSVPTSTSFTYSDSGVDGSNAILQTMEGFAFQNDKIFRVDNSIHPLQNITSVNLSSTNGAMTGVLEGTPEVSEKFVASTVPTNEVNSDTGEYYSIIKLHGFDFGHSSPVCRISQENGSTLSPLAKFNFPTDISVGLNAYCYSGGLIEETAKVLYGVESDTYTYPGVVSGGNSVEISGPMVRRIQVSLSVKLQGGTAAAVISKVQSAVAGVINQSPIGQNIPISSIVAAANKVVGVGAVSVDSPIYNNQNEFIVIRQSEKPMVINPSVDIQVSILG